MDGWIGGRWHVDGTNLIRERVQDVEPIIEHNKALQNDHETPDDVMGRRIAKIPLIIVERWINEDGMNILDTAKHGKKAIERFIRRKLSDPDWRYLKTR